MTYSGLEKIAKGATQDSPKVQPKAMTEAMPKAMPEAMTEAMTEAKRKGKTMSKNTLMRDAIEGSVESLGTTSTMGVTALVGESLQAKNVGLSELVPDTYEISFADGMLCDEGLLAAATPLFKDMGLTQKQAQQLAELHASHVRKMEQSYAESVQAWRIAAEQDPEIGGVDYPKKLAVIARAANAFGSKELLELLDSTGVGNHPEMLRFFYKIGRALMQDGFMAGSNKVSSTDPISLVYPKLKPY